MTDTTAPQRSNLLGMTREEMEAFFLSIGEKKFRAAQVMKWIHHEGCDDFASMTNLSKALRTRLEEVAEIRGPGVVYEGTSSDGTRKWVLEVEDGSYVETVLIPAENGKRRTLCVSSQVGCSLDCSFCSTGKQGFQRNLTAAEIIGQVWVASNSFGPRKDTANRPVTNVVMMGMGEPLLNYDNVVPAMKLMLDDNGYSLSKRRVTLSTSGVVPMLDRLGDELDVSLAISLHAANDELRNELVPLNRKYDIRTLLDACQRYLGKCDDTRVVTIEYTLIKDVNDQQQHARELAELLKGNDSLDITVHDNFAWWAAEGAEVHPQIAQAIQHANGAMMPSARIDTPGADAAWWVDAGERAHIRWVRPEDEDALFDAMARLHNRGELTLGEGSSFAGSFRTTGLLVPVFDLDNTKPADHWVDGLTTLDAKFTEALTETGELSSDERASRNGLRARQVTLR